MGNTIDLNWVVSKGRKVDLNLGGGLRWEWVWFWSGGIKRIGKWIPSKKLYEVLKELINVVLNIQCLYWTYTDHLYFNLLNSNSFYSTYITLSAKVIQRLFKIKKDQGIWPRDNARCVFKHSPTTPVLRILGGAETGRWLWLPESQPHYQLSKKPSHKGISYGRSEEHTSELQSRTTISYAVFCLKKKKKKKKKKK